MYMVSVNETKLRGKVHWFRCKHSVQHSRCHLGLEQGSANYCCKKLNSEYLGLGRTLSPSHCPYCHCSGKQSQTTCEWVWLCTNTAFFQSFKSEILESVVPTKASLTFKKSFKNEIYSWCAIQKQMASQIWLMGHGLLILVWRMFKTVCITLRFYEILFH